jgi:hypothetical protein
MKYLCLKINLTKFIAQETQWSILNHAARAEKALDALPCDFDSPRKIG